MGRWIDVHFPLGGLNERYSHDAQPPYTSPELLNVVPDETIEGRERGGSRPGNAKYLSTQIGSGAQVNSIIAVESGNAVPIETFTEEFTGTSIDSSVWDTCAALSIDSYPDVSGGAASAPAAAGNPRGGIRKAITDFDLSSTRVFAMDINWEQNYLKDIYYLYADLDDTAPTSSDGIALQVWSDGRFYEPFTLTCRLTVSRSGVSLLSKEWTYNPVVGGALGRLAIVVAGSTVTTHVYDGVGVLLGATTNAVPGYTSAGSRFGFGLQSSAYSSAYSYSTPTAYRFTAQYATTSADTSPTCVVASSGGTVYYTDQTAALTAAAGSSTVRTDETLMTTSRSAVSYICDYGQIDVGETLGTLKNVGSSDVLQWGTDTHYNGYGISVDDHIVEVTESSNETELPNGTYKIAALPTASYSGTGAYYKVITSELVDLTASFPALTGYKVAVTIDGTTSVLTVTSNSATSLYFATGPAEYGVSCTYAVYSANAGLSLTDSYGTAVSVSADRTCTFRICRSIKTFTLSSQTVAQHLHTYTKGDIPVNCSMMVRYRDRLVLSGDPWYPMAVFASKAGDFSDWDFGASDTDPTRAWTVTPALGGQMAASVKALVPWQDDYLIISTGSALWNLRGDPTYGGSLVQVSEKVGIISRFAACSGPDGSLYFLSSDGLYMMPPGASAPVVVSKSVIPKELLNIDTASVEPILLYDLYNRGVHIYLTRKSSSVASIHWFMSLPRGTFWPFSVPVDQEPVSGMSLPSSGLSDSDVVLGCRDGYLRSWRTNQTTDDGTTISSSVTYGPIYGGGPITDAVINQLVATLDDTSGDVTMTIATGTTPEEALAATASFTETLSAGVSYRIRPRVRGAWWTLKLTSTSRWAIESIKAELSAGGQMRRL